jgi:hypothetical protein
MPKIVLYADTLKIEKPTIFEHSAKFSGDILIAGRNAELQGPRMETIRNALNIILMAFGPDGEIEVRNRTD